MNQVLVQPMPKSKFNWNVYINFKKFQSKFRSKENVSDGLVVIKTF